jgi:hypothetical protein
MKTFLIFVMVATAIADARSQVSAYWKGGKPGCPNEWNCPANWSNHRVPDAFTNVYILANENLPCYYPVIHESGCEANSLYIQPNAYLSFEKNGTLRIWEPSSSHFEAAQIMLKHGLKLNDALVIEQP